MLELWWLVLGIEFELDQLAFRGGAEVLHEIITFKGWD